MSLRQQEGFTLIEVMIVLVVIIILASIVVPTYNSYTLKSRRSDGIGALLGLANAQERYRNSNPQYGSLAQIGGASSSGQGYYTLSVSGTSATGYVLTATGRNGQENDSEGDTACNLLSLSMANGTLSKSPSACWPT